MTIDPAILDSFGMARGVVKFFNMQKGYGFIVPVGKIGTAAPDIFVHISDVERSGLTTLSAGQLVEYRSAQHLKLIATPRR